MRWILAAALLGCSACAASDAEGVSDDSLATHAHPAAGSTDVDVVVEPSDSGAALLAAIHGASTSVHVTMYLLADVDMIAGLIERHQAGVDVKVILNQKFSVTGETNQGAFDKLKAAGVSVVWSPSTFTYTHEKCVVIDGKAAWIMTMNAAATSFTKNREFLGIDTTPADVTEAEGQFAADFANQPFTPSGALLVSPTTMRPGIVGVITGAAHTIDFEVEEFTDLAIATAFCDAVTRHVVVRGAHSTQALSTNGQRVVDQLKSCGVAMVKTNRPYVHAKAIIADGARVYVGSANFSPTSLDHNRELGFVTSSAPVLTKVSAAISEDIASGVPF